MVRLFSIIFFALIFPLMCFGKSPEVFVDVDNTTTSEGQAIHVIVSVSRDNGVDVDTTSFRLGDDSIKVQFIGDSRRSIVKIVNGVRTEEDVVTSKYKFVIEPQEKGYHSIPSISVVVGGEEYSSPSTTFEVESGVTDNSFRLEHKFEGSLPLYPGQRFKLTYRIFFQQNIDLSRQDLYLLDADVFRKVGEITEKRFNKTRGIVHELSQEYQATQPGEYVFPESVIEGYTYKLDLFGRKAYKKPRLKAEAPSKTITVQPFPNVGMPASFNGALGSFDVEVSMLTTDQLRVGDKIELQIDFSGRGEFSTVKLPDVFCQPGFNVAFRFSDLPPSGEMIDTPKGPVKRFIFEIRPLTHQVKEIPSIEFSSFDPIGQTYIKTTLEPIPINVEPLKRLPKKKQDEQVAPPTTEVFEDENRESKNWSQILGVNAPIEIKGNQKLQLENLKAPMFGWKVVYLIPIGVLLLIAQLIAQKLLQINAEKERKVKARDLLKKAGEKGEIEDVLVDVKQALLLRLEEKAVVAIKDWRKLPIEGVPGEVRTFIETCEVSLYSGAKGLTKEHVIRDAKILFDKIKRITG